MLLIINSRVPPRQSYRRNYWQVPSWLGPQLLTA